MKPHMPTLPWIVGIVLVVVIVHHLWIRHSYGDGE